MALNNYMDFVPPTTRILDLKYSREVEGIENVPTEGSAIIAINHRGFADPFLVSVAVAEHQDLRRPITWGAKSEYFDGDGLGHGFLGGTVKNFVNNIELVSVHRGEKDGYQRLHDDMAPKVEQGKLLGIFPEGTRAPDERLYKFLTGAARLAIDFQIPIVPTGLIYDRSRRLRKITARTAFGQAINPDDFAGMKPFELTDFIRGKIQTLTGQELADISSYRFKQEQKRSH